MPGNIVPTTLQQMLGNVQKEEFVRDFLHKQAFSRPGVPKDLMSLGTWESFSQIATASEADLMVVRQGERYSGQPPSSREQLQALCAEGYTVLVRHAERHRDELQAVANDFARDFNAPVNIHMYATPGGEWGFPWHYDAEEVFIVQTAGQKEYSLRKNTVNPWPLEETLPADMQYEREIMPLMRVDLAAGDWLYIPGGWWHKAATKSDDIALSLAIGVMPRTALDVLDFLREKLRDSMLWRQRLPLVNGNDDAADADMPGFPEIFAMLSGDLQRELNRHATVEELKAYLRPDDK